MRSRVRSVQWTKMNYGMSSFDIGMSSTFRRLRCGSLKDAHLKKLLSPRLLAL